MGIEPIGAAELDLGRYTEHRVVDPFGVTEVVDEMLASERPDASSAEASPSVAGSQVMAGPTEPKSVLADTNPETAPSSGATADRPLKE
jgi:hypothetical protein